MSLEFPDILREIITEKDLQNRLKELADQISNDYKDKNLLLICVMNGSVFLTVDLVKYLTVPAEIDYIVVGSYHGGTTSSGKVSLFRDIQIEIDNYDVLIVEDILDTGRTFSFLVEHFKNKNPKSLKTFSLLDKPDRRVVDVTLDYRGFIIPDVFIVGYGMDYLQKYRQLPFIGELKPEVYSK
ncbi:MAG: hypoxanthine phosphoribosyltransferase [Candidatus Sericytochromatia bacterium]